MVRVESNRSGTHGLHGAARLGAVFVAMLVPWTATGQETRPASELSTRTIENFVECRRLEAANELCAQETKHLEALLLPGSPSANLLEQLQTLDAPVRRSLSGVLAENSRPAVEDLTAASAKLSEQIQDLKSGWQAIRTSLEQRQSLLFEVRGSRQVAGQLASLLSVDNRWFWLFGLLAIATLVGLAVHDRRHEVRKFLRGGRARTLGLSKILAAATVLLALITASTFLLGNRIYEAMLSASSGEEASPRQAVETENVRLEERIKSLQQAGTKLDQRHTQAIAAVEQKMTAGASQDPISAPWQESRRVTLEIGQQLSVLGGLTQAMETDRAELEKLNEELAAQAGATAQYLRMRQWIRGGLGLFLAIIVAVGGLLFRRSVRERQTKTADTCPLCLGRVRVKPEPVRNGTPQGPKVVRCENLLSREPPVECGYTFRDIYRPMPKLSFPTLGVPKAGKTHWLSMLYWQLNRGNYPRAVQFERIKRASGDGGEDFDIIIEHILFSRMGTAATQRDRVPHPLVFNFQDHDQLGKSNLLVNIFDYSGEVTLDMGVDDYRRRRALDADGFFFFLDPTYPAEPQAKALADFREDLRLVKGVRTGREVRIPVALCVSKIDLLAGQGYALPDGSDPVARFYEDLARIDPTGEAMTLAVMEARSSLVAQLRDTIWPGWQIERTIHDLFGGRYMFFPVTPVGLDGRGEVDLSQRTISPFGLIEPLLWLLEMNGYRVL